VVGTIAARADPTGGGAEEVSEMGQRFVLTVGEERAVCELLDVQAPGIAKRFAECLPLDSFAIHAKFAGGEMIVMLPFVADSENEVLSVSTGDIGYFPDMQTLCLFYGDVVPFGKVSVFARVVENLSGVRRAAERLHETVSVPVCATRT